MIGVSIKGDMSEILSHLRSIGPNVDKAASAAINRAAEATRTVARRKIAKDTSYPQAVVGQRMAVRRSNPSTLRAEVIAYPFAPNIGKFGRPAQNRTGTAATAWATRKTYKSAFRYKGTDRVVSRVGKERFPLKGLKGPSVRKQFMRPETIAEMDARAITVFRERFRHELNRRGAY